jgi:hypothetical protein
MNTNSSHQAHVHIGVAMKGNFAHHSVSDTLERVKAQAWPLGVLVTHKVETRGDVCIGRGLLVQQMLDHPKRPTHWLSIDDDVAGFTGEDIARNALCGVDVIFGNVPGRGFDPRVLAKAVRDGVPPEELDGYLSEPLVYLRPGAVGQHPKAPHLLGPIDYGSLGWMMVTRGALERMVQALPKPERTCQVLGHGETYPRLFKFTENAEGQTMDDSSYFARLWQEQCGGDVWVDTVAKIAHWGLHPYQSAPLVERMRLTHVPGARHPRDPSARRLISLPGGGS